MEMGTIVIVAVCAVFIAMLIEMAYYIGKRQGHLDCAPEIERSDRYRDAVYDLNKWCGHESPHARLISEHILAVGEGLAMNAGTPCGDEPCTISGLREQLRRLAPVEEGK